MLLRVHTEKKIQRTQLLSLIGISEEQHCRDGLSASSGISYSCQSNLCTPFPISTLIPFPITTKLGLVASLFQFTESQGSPNEQLGNWVNPCVAVMAKHCYIEYFYYEIKPITIVIQNSTSRGEKKQVKNSKNILKTIWLS